MKKLGAAGTGAVKSRPRWRARNRSCDVGAPVNPGRAGPARLPAAAAAVAVTAAAAVVAGAAGIGPGCRKAANGALTVAANTGSAGAEEEAAEEEEEAAAAVADFAPDAGRVGGRSAGAAGKPAGRATCLGGWAGRSLMGASLSVALDPCRYVDKADFDLGRAGVALLPADAAAARPLAGLSSGAGTPARGALLVSFF